MGETQAAAAKAGALYDLGYQRYTGVRLQRANSVRTLFAFSLRTAFGLGRGARSKVIPSIILAVVFIPAIVSVGAASTTGFQALISYSNHLQFTSFLIALFAAAQAPELIVTDRQYGVLTLYLARPLTGVLYALAKLGALVAAMMVLTFGPQLLLFLGKVFIATSPWTAFKDEWTVLGPLIAGTLTVSAFIGSVALAISSFAGRRAYASASVIGFFLLVPAAATAIRSLATGQTKRYLILVHPIEVITGFGNWIFHIEAKRRTQVGRADLPGSYYLAVMLAVIIIATTVLLLRYRRNEA
jgi:ABC-2 type transport system permease protein